MCADTTGVAMIGQILELLLRDEACSAFTLARDLRSARATTYEVVGQLERSGFIDRSAAGRITPGQMSAALGFAAFGLGRLVGAAEALLPVLRDDTGRERRPRCPQRRCRDRGGAPDGAGGAWEPGGRGHR